MEKNLNTQILDLLLKRDLLLQRVSNSLNKQIANEYIKIINNALDSFNKQEISIINMNKIIKEISKRFEFDYDTIAYEQFKELGIAEATYIPQSINALVGVDIVSKVLPEPLIEKVINASFLDKGLLLKDAFAKFDDNLKNVMINEIRNGVLIGATNQQMISNMKPLFNAMTSNNLDSLVKTSVSTVVNDVRMQTYKENESIFKGYEHLSTLDKSTTYNCANRDGATYDLDFQGTNIKGKEFPFKKPPLHYRCRSVILPITKSYRELGLDIDEIPKGSRASMDGSVPETTTFTEWFEGKDKKFQEQYLGKGRFELFKDGKITLSQLVNQQGLIIPIKDLNKLSDVVAKPKIPVIDFGYDGKFNKYVADIRDEAKIVIDKLPKPKTIEMATSDAHFLQHKDFLQVRDNKMTFLHEYGHSIDDKLNGYFVENKFVRETTNLGFASKKMLSKSAVDDSILLNTDDNEVLKSYADKWFTTNPVYYKSGKKKGMVNYYLKSPLEERYSHYSDILDSLSGGKMADKFYVAGHGSRYYSNNKYNKDTENFANLFALWSDKTHWEETKTLFPNMTAKFETIMKEVIDGKFD
jgi:SPP1 gp7 family putative phage head morphogenesis protein